MEFTNGEQPGARLAKAGAAFPRIPQRVKSNGCRRESSERQNCQGHQEETIGTAPASPSDGDQRKTGSFACRSTGAEMPTKLAHRPIPFWRNEPNPKDGTALGPTRFIKRLVGVAANDTAMAQHRGTFVTTINRAVCGQAPLPVPLGRLFLEAANQPALASI